MNMFMFYKGAVSLESSITYSTYKRAFGTMNAFMVNKFTFSLERRTTLTTFKMCACHHEQVYACQGWIFEKK